MNRENEIDQREPMTCLEFREVLHELDRHGTRGAAAFDSAMVHAESCGDCGALLVEEESLDFALQKIAQETARMPGAARVEAALLKEFSRVNQQTSQVVPLHNNRRWLIPAIGVAAAILLSFGVILYQHLTQHSVNTNSTSVASDVNQPASPSVAPASTEPVNQAPAVSNAANPAVASNSKVPATAADSSGTEYATAYVPLPFADDSAVLEGGSVVRVTMARSALESYGLPADAMGAGDRVTADMILSEDGTPQAIRLVAQED
jgi:hypothetical protein